MKKALPHSFAIVFIISAIFSLLNKGFAQQATPTAADGGVNIAVVATPSTSFVSGNESLGAINDGYDPRNSRDRSHGAYGNWPRNGTQWVQYEWSQPISTGKVDVYWFDDRGGIRLPTACRLKYWEGDKFVSVNNSFGLGVKSNAYNTTTFDEVKTSKIRLEFDSAEGMSTGVLEWKVYDSGKSPNFPPSVTAGIDRSVILGGKTYLKGAIKDDGKPNAAPSVQWSKESGPGDVTFADANAPETTATFSAPGDYELKLTGSDGELSSSSTLKVSVDPPPQGAHLEMVYTKNYKIDNPLWNNRAKALIVNWIPHCIDKISDPNLREGGIANFVEAAKKLAGQPAKRHVGYWFSNAWVYNTIEAMCVALMVDPQGDADIIAAQNAYKATLDDWIPKILAAQEPDGYLQTLHTLNGDPRWTNKINHEGYTAGYFLEAAIAHYLMTNKTDPRMYNAAKKLADCWCENIGPAPKKTWYEGHQEVEQALARFARFVDSEEGAGKGRKYLELAKFMLDSRKNGEEYDQSHLPVVQQYEAVGHSVRAAYSYSGMADIAMDMGDMDYLSAVVSLWDSIVNRKYYVTGGVGSGETSEGFGKDYSLPNNAYCESCANCGELFFQHKLNMIFHDAKYADLCEETLYNAILGDIDMEGKNFYYTNPLSSGGSRYAWHNCPCCVGNIPRVLLMLPTWMYAKSADSIYVNLFIGSTATVENVAGTDVKLVQATDYPWNGKVSLTVEPAAEKSFAVKIRVPNREVSGLYKSTPETNGIVSLAVNGESITPVMDKGYAVINRTWRAGDKIDFELPMKVQRVKASEKIAADRGRVALRYGPLVYNIESIDQNVDGVLSPTSELTTEWKPDLLGGVTVIKGAFADGTPMTAIPNYARNNGAASRGKSNASGSGATGGGAAEATNQPAGPGGRGRGGRSIVWIKDQ